jgi:integrase
MALTDKELQSLNPREKHYKVFDGDGLHIVITPRGGKYWYLKYAYQGKPEEVSLGTYPAVTLKQARERCSTIRRDLVLGINPRLEKIKKKLQVGVTFAAVAEEWLTMMSVGTSVKSKTAANGESIVPDNSVLDEATVKKHRWLLNSYLNPAIGKLPTADITSHHVLAVIKKIERDGKRETAHRARSLTSRILCYAHSTNRAPQGDITWSLRDALAPTVVKHHASITDPVAVGKLLRAIDSYKGQLVTSCALKLAPLLMLRPFELRFGEWREVDFKNAEWRIPASRMKMPSQHIVPLSRQALSILYELKSRTGNEKHMFTVFSFHNSVMSDFTINKALRSLGYFGDVMTGHGFRSMASTLLNEQQKWHPDAIERQLAHAPRDKIRATYNYAEHLPERRKMMQAWADYLDELREAAQDSAQDPEPKKAVAR